MSIGSALRELSDAHGLRVAEVAGRFGEGRHRNSFYRVLSGAGTDPRVSTLLEFCKVLMIDPDELLHAVGLLQWTERSPESIDLELRRAYADLQGLNDGDKRLCLAILRGVLKERTRPPAGHREAPRRTA